MPKIIVIMQLNEIGPQIAAARKLGELGQRQLAEQAGVSRATVDALENGRAAEIGFSKLTRILAAVGLELRLGPVSADRPTLDELLREDAGDDSHLDR
jgi:transcriptional regulator with XRE-family HTH domain